MHSRRCRRRLFLKSSGSRPLRTAVAGGGVGSLPPPALMIDPVEDEKFLSVGLCLWPVCLLCVVCMYFGV